MLDFTCAHLLMKAKGKSKHEVLTQKVELNFQNSGVELLQDSPTLDHGRTFCHCCIPCLTFCISLMVKSHFQLIGVFCLPGCAFAYAVDEITTFSVSNDWSSTWMWRSLGLPYPLIKLFWLHKCSCCLANWYFFVDSHQFLWYCHRVCISSFCVLLPSNVILNLGVNRIIFRFGFFIFYFWGCWIVSWFIACSLLPKISVFIDSLIVSSRLFLNMTLVVELIGRACPNLTPAFVLIH